MKRALGPLLLCLVGIYMVIFIVATVIFFS